MRFLRGIGIGIGIGILLAAWCAPAAGAQAPPPGTTERVSVDSSGGQADTFFTPGGIVPGSFGPRVSGDGRVVVFTSNATDLVPGDANGNGDCFVHVRATGATELVSISTSGVKGDGYSGCDDVSGDGRFVAFLSTSDNLVADDTNGNIDVFVRDRTVGTTELVSRDGDGRQYPGASLPGAMTPDGRFVLFSATPPGGCCTGSSIVRDRLTGTVETVSVDTDGTPLGGGTPYDISDDGRLAVFQVSGSGSTGSQRLLIRDRQSASTQSVAVGGATTAFTASISGDGRVVGYNQDNQVRSFDRVAATTESIDAAVLPVLSGDGRIVAYMTSAVGGPSPQAILVRDRTNGVIEQASVNGAGEPANNGSFFPDISADGRVVVFESPASNLVPGDTNGVSDDFARDRTPVPIPDPTVDQQFADLRDRIVAFGAHQGTTRSLLAKVDAADSARRRGNTAAACGSLGALQHAARAQAGKKLTPAQAAELIDRAVAIENSLGCRPK